MFGLFLFKAWGKVTHGYNCAQTTGTKTFLEIQTKYKNLRAQSKKNLPQNAKEIRNTRGSAASKSLNFSEITGLNSRFDDDDYAPDDSEYVPDYTEEDFFEEAQEMKTVVEEPDLSQFVAPKPKKKRLSVVRDALVEAKVEGIKLDNEMKALEIKFKTELYRLELEERSLKNETLKLQILAQEKKLGISEDSSDPLI